MVMAQPMHGDPNPGPNGVVGSFYDFFAGLYSTSFTANQNWSGPFLGDGGSENQPPLKRNQTEHSGISKQGFAEPQSPQPNAHRAVTAPSGFAGPRPHKPSPLEHGWPDDDPPPIRSRMPSMQDVVNRPGYRSPPAGFPPPQSPLLESKQQQLGQMQRELQEQRELMVREQEQQLLQHQQQLQYQQEQQHQLLQQQQQHVQQQQQTQQQQRQDQAGKHGDANYRGDADDLLDQHVAYFIRKHPEVCEKHSIQKKSVGVYQLDGREVQIEWRYATEPGGQGFLVVVDGPLRQPFSDYMMDTDLNAQYEGQDIGKSNLHMIPRERRHSFKDHHKVYSRLEAMKVAKEQALVREKAATYVKDGREVPNELFTKYKKNLKIKLGLHRPKGQRAHASPQLDSEIVMPVMPASLSPQVTAPAEQPVQLLQQPQLPQLQQIQQPPQVQQGEHSPSGQLFQPPPTRPLSTQQPGSPLMPPSSRPASVQMTPPSRPASIQVPAASAPGVIPGFTPPCLPQPQLTTPQLLYSPPGHLQGSPLGSSPLSQPMPLQAPMGSAPLFQTPALQVPPMPGTGLNWANAALQLPAGAMPAYHTM
eukprot:TRINITY_DN6684_c0_g2_i1.p1 TRINITY_DN6684_c0_g2~~TRINITY_DN6684_c0_g2_i1.p1  ORF type:complete len:611 (+),score=111.50 TRINITY_DN6684_c0_g2_i1:71-1834(+)